jgi:hypothetical protein
MHIKIKVIYGLSAEEHEFEVAALMTLNELQGKLDEIHDHVSPAVKRYQFMAAGELDALDITFELDNKIRDIADLFDESGEICLRALPLDYGEVVTDALAVAQVRAIDASVAASGSTLNKCPQCGVLFGTSRDTLASGGTCRPCLELHVKKR